MAGLPKSQELMTTILQSLPKAAEATRIEYEGPRKAIYTINYQFLVENNQLISDIVNTVNRRLVIRTDKSIRKSEDTVMEKLKSSISKETEIGNCYFDDALGEVIVEVKDPQLFRNNDKIN